MTPVRILIVEDDPAVLSTLGEMYRTIFVARGYEAMIEQATTVEDARRLAKAAKSKPYDLVSLDVNLGDASLTGLDVLETLKRFRSAWMAVLLTGVETDSTVDQTMGEAKGDALRKHLRRDAYSRFPAERLLVVEKPSASIPMEDAQTLLKNRVAQIALVYEEVSRLRYVFRPIEVVSLERVPAPKGTKSKRKFIETTALHWQIRFNCGEMRTLPDMAGFRTLHFLLSRDRDQSVTPEEALVNDPKNDKTKGNRSPVTDADPVAAYFEAQGIAWSALAEGAREQLIRAALSLKFGRYRELRAYQDDDDLSPAEEAELGRMLSELGPLSEAAETAYQRMRPQEQQVVGEADVATENLHQSGLHVAGGNYDRLRNDQRGQESPASQVFRARMKRVKDCLRENGFADFAEHIEGYVQSTGANWSYNPPEGIEWTT